MFECGEIFDADYGMICRKGGVVTLRHSELRDVEADLPNTVCNDMQIGPVLQGFT